MDTSYKLAPAGENISNGKITDFKGGTYNILAVIHTHAMYENLPKNYAIQPSQADIDFSQNFGFTSYIITDYFYTKVDLSIPQNSHSSLGLTSDFWTYSNPPSLFK